MANCFTCDSKLYSENTRVCSSITQHSHTPYPEKIVEMLGEEFLVIVTADGQMCKKCTSLLNYFDKCKNDLRLVRNTMLSNIQKKYGILPPDQVIRSVEVINGHLRTEEQQVKGKCKVPDSVPIVFPTATTTADVTPIQTPLKLLKTQQQCPPQQHKLQKQSPYHRQQQESAKKIKTYKCRFCGFHSKEIGKVRFHMRTHANKYYAKKPILNQGAAETLTTVPQQKKILFMSSPCSKNVDSQFNCADHMLKDHNQPTLSTSNMKREKDNEDTEMPEQKEADHKTSDSVKKEADEDY